MNQFGSAIILTQGSISIMLKTTKIYHTNLASVVFLITSSGLMTEDRHHKALPSPVVDTIMATKRSPLLHQHGSNDPALNSRCAPLDPPCLVNRLWKYSQYNRVTSGRAWLFTTHGRSSLWRENST